MNSKNNFTRLLESKANNMKKEISIVEGLAKGAFE